VRTASRSPWEKREKDKKDKRQMGQYGLAGVAKDELIDLN
jgi:hypothetical protein